MIFFPDKVLYEKPASYGFDFEEVAVTTADQVKLHGWFLKAREEKGVLLFLHGNGGNISGRGRPGFLPAGYRPAPVSAVARGADTPSPRSPPEPSP